MKILQSLWHADGKWQDLAGTLIGADAQLVLAFGLREQLEETDIHGHLQQRFPAAHIAIASTCGNLSDQIIDDSGVMCTALRLEKSTLRACQANLADHPDLPSLCRALAAELLDDGLRHVFVLSDGGMVNGTELSDTFNRALPAAVTLSGGLAGDGTDFVKTLVGLDAPPSSGTIVAIGFYGDSLEFSFGSSGGWTPFGPVRAVTKSAGNCLHELDGKPALQLYKSYLGDQVAGLPASALRFPLSITLPNRPAPVVRTILSIDEPTNTMTFAGDVPEGASARLMRASYEDLIDGAQDAAQQAQLHGVELVLCVSCVGRRIVLGQRTEEELECVRAVFGSAPVISGFYSYGELSPSRGMRDCQLQNQTMCITGIREA